MGSNIYIINHFTEFSVHRISKNLLISTAKAIESIARMKFPVNCKSLYFVDLVGLFPVMMTPAANHPEDKLISQSEKADSQKMSMRII